MMNDKDQPEEGRPGSKEGQCDFALEMNHHGTEENDLSKVHDENSGRPEQFKVFHGGVLLSTFYGILLVILGIALPTNEALQGRWLEDNILAVYQVYLYGVGFIFLISLELYLAFFNKCRKRTTKDSEMRHSNSESEPGYVNMAFDAENKPQTTRWRQLGVKELRHSNRSSVLSESTVFEYGDKMAARGRTSEKRMETTLYIRIVFIVLGLAVMVYDGLLIKQLQEGLSASICNKSIIFWPQYVHVAFLLVQCYFLFKHSKLKSLKYRHLLRVGFTHVMATDINEMIRAFITQIYSGNMYYKSRNLVSMNENSTEVPPCSPGQEDILNRAAPYLYPCVIEYNFLAAGLVYYMYCSLGDVTNYCSSYATGSGPAIPPIEITCKRTHKGLFFGTVLLAGTTVSVILFFSYLRTNQDGSLSLLLYEISDVALHVVLILTIVVTWFQTTNLSVISMIHLAFEDGILLISMSLGILFNIFLLLPIASRLVNGKNDPHLVLSLTGSILTIVSGVLQTSFMVELSCRGLTRASEWDRKPGRGGVMFLLLTNLAIWLLKTFQLRSLELVLDIHQDSYGYLPWLMMIDSLVPFLVYYYLFSSACLARTWHQVYTESTVSVMFDAQYSPRFEHFSKPAKEFEFVRQRKVTRAMKLDVGTIICPVSDV